MNYAIVAALLLCSYCCFVFGAEQGNHRFECTSCGKCLTNRTGLVKHTRVHTGERPFACKQCSRPFSQESNLKRHVQQVHQNERKFICEVGGCKRTFSRKAHLVAHAKAHEAHPVDGLSQVKSSSRKVDASLPHLAPTVSLALVAPQQQTQCDIPLEDLGMPPIPLLPGTLFERDAESAWNNPVSQVPLAAIVLQQQNPLDERVDRLTTKRKAPHANPNEQKKQRWKRATSGDEEKQKEFKCTFPECTWSFDDLSSRNRHIEGQHEHKKRFFCSYPECSFGSLYKYALGRHIKKSHLAHATSLAIDAPQQQPQRDIPEELLLEGYAGFMGNDSVSQVSIPYHTS